MIRGKIFFRLINNLSNTLIEDQPVVGSSPASATTETPVCKDGRGFCLSKKAKNLQVVVYFMFMRCL